MTLCFSFRCDVIQSRFFWLTVLVLSVYLLYLLSPILTPFLMAAILAYLGDPLADRLEARNMPRMWAVTTVFAVLILIAALIILVLIPAIDRQLSGVIQNIPHYLDWLREHIAPSLQTLLNISPDELNGETVQSSLQQHIGTASSLVRSIIGSLKGPAGLIITWLTYLFLVPVITFYLLRDWDILVAKINQLIPRQYQPTVATLARQSDAVLGGFLRGQLLVMTCLGIIYAIGLRLVGLDMAILIGLFAGLVSFVPYLGLIVGITIAGIMALIQFQDWVHLIGVVAVFVVAQILEGTILTPKLVGDRTGLHPVAVLFSVLAGGQLFGFMGVLLALPVAAVINVFLGHFKTHYLESPIYHTPNPNSQTPEGE